MDSRAHANLIQVTQGNDTIMKNGFARALSNTTDPEVDRYLITLTKDDNDLVRVNAVKSLGEHRRSENIDALREVLEQDENSGVRRMAATALGKVDDREAYDILVDRLEKETEDEVLTNIAASLGEFENEEAIEPLSRLLDNEFWVLRNTASWALVKIGTDEVMRWAHHFTRRASQREAFSSAVFIENMLKGKYSPEYFIDQFKTQINDEARCAQLINLKEYARHLLWYVDETRRPSEKCAQYEMKLRPTVQPILTALRKSDDFNERACCAEALGWYPDHVDIVPALIKAIEDESDEVSNFAFDGTIRMGGKEQLRKVLSRQRYGGLRESDEERTLRWCEGQVIELGIK